MKVFTILLLSLLSAIAAQAEEPDSILTLAYRYADMNEWDKAIDVVVEEYYNINGKSSDKRKKADYLTLLADLYSKRGRGDDYMKAIEHTNKVLSIYDKGTKEYLDCSHNLSYYYYLHNDLNKANDAATDAIRLSTNFYGENSEKNAFELKAYSDRYSRAGYYPLTIKYADAFFTILENRSSTHIVEYVDKKYDIAAYYNAERNYQAELEILLQVESIVKDIYSDQSSEYLHCIYCISLAYNLLRNMEEYEKWERKARDILVNLGIYEAVNIKETPIYSNKSKQYADAGDYVNAIKTEEVSLNIYTAHMDSLSMAKSFNSISNYYYRDGDLGNAIENGTHAIDIYTTKNASSTDCALAFNNMSVYMHDNKDDQSALLYATKALAMYEQYADTVNDKNARTFYANMLTNVALYNKQLGNSEAASKYAKQSTIMSNNGGAEQKNENTVVNYYNEAMVAYSGGKTEDLEVAFRKALNMQAEIINENVAGKGKSEIATIWADNNFVHTKAPIIIYAYDKSESLATDAYNALLYTRCIESGDVSNVSTVEAISNSLGDGEMAIEFFSIDSQNLGKAYAALLIGHNWTNAKCVKLFVNQDLHNIEFKENVDLFELAKSEEGRNTIFTDPRVGSTIWDNMLPYLEGVKKIYMVPCDLINSFVIEDLICINSKQPLSTLHTFQRIASTGQIVTGDIQIIPITGKPLIRK